MSFAELLAGGVANEPAAEAAASESLSDTEGTDESGLTSSCESAVDWLLAQCLRPQPAADADDALPTETALVRAPTQDASLTLAGADASLTEDAIPEAVTDLADAMPASADAGTEAFTLDPGANSFAAPPLAAANHDAALHPARAEAVAAPPMDVTPDHPEFIEELGERIVWITDGGLQEARIELHPAELGVLSVQVQIRGDEAQIAFGAEQAATRALLNNALPQLRALFSAQGLHLMRARVDGREAAGTRESAFASLTQGRGASAPTRRVSSLRLVDAYV